MTSSFNYLNYIAQKKSEITLVAFFRVYLNF